MAVRSWPTDDRALRSFSPHLDRVSPPEWFSFSRFSSSFSFFFFRFPLANKHLDSPARLGGKKRAQSTFLHLFPSSRRDDRCRGAKHISIKIVLLPCGEENKGISLASC
jgi:hypothetical protein